MKGGLPRLCWEQEGKKKKKKKNINASERKAFKRHTKEDNGDGYAGGVFNFTEAQTFKRSFFRSATLAQKRNVFSVSTGAMKW